MAKKQLEFNLNKGSWGGRRKGSGRRRIHSKGVAHRTREKVNSRTPVHVNFKYKVFIKNKLCLKILKRAVIKSSKHGLKVIHYSLQHNHIHLVLEASDNKILTKGMRSLLITFAKRVGKGKIQLERYHLHVLRTLAEARNAIHYVLFNEQKHSKNRNINEYSSLLNLKQANVLIRNYAKKEKVTLIVEKLKCLNSHEVHAFF